MGPTDWGVPRTNSPISPSRVVRMNPFQRLQPVSQMLYGARLCVALSLLPVPSTGILYVQHVVVREAGCRADMRTIPTVPRPLTGMRTRYYTSSTTGYRAHAQLCAEPERKGTPHVLLCPKRAPIAWPTVSPHYVSAMAHSLDGGNGEDEVAHTEVNERRCPAGLAAFEPARMAGSNKQFKCTAFDPGNYLMHTWICWRRSLAQCGDRASFCDLPFCSEFAVEFFSEFSAWDIFSSQG